MGKLSHSVVNTPPKSKQTNGERPVLFLGEIRVGCNTRRASCSFTGKWSHAVVNRTAEIAKKNGERPVLFFTVNQQVVARRRKPRGT